MRDLRRKRKRAMQFLTAIVLCGLFAGVLSERVSAQEKPQPEASRLEGPENATLFSEMVRPTNAKGAANPLKVEVRQWTVSRSAKAFEMPDLGFYIVHLVYGEIITEIAGKTTPHHPGDFWVVEKGQHMAISMQRPREQAALQTIALSPGH